MDKAAADTGAASASADSKLEDLLLDVPVPSVFCLIRADDASATGTDDDANAPTDFAPGAGADAGLFFGDAMSSCADMSSVLALLLRAVPAECCTEALEGEASAGGARPTAEVATEAASASR